jgi:hypothetical protein
MVIGSSSSGGSCVARIAASRVTVAMCDPFLLCRPATAPSPWSSHGELTGTKGKTQKQINAEARAKFEHDMKKHKDYYHKHGIFALIYTDSDLADMDGVFADVKECLERQTVMTQVNFHLLSGFFAWR